MGKTSGISNDLKNPSDACFGNIFSVAILKEYHFRTQATYFVRLLLLNIFHEDKFM